jgi:predicted dehydrogenase
MNGIHNLNTMRYVTGLEVDRVFAEYGTFVTPVEVEDLISITYRYQNGAIGSLEAGSAIRGRSAGAEVDRIYGTAGQITLSERGPLSIYTTVATAGFPTDQWCEIPLTPLTIDEHKMAMVDGFAGPILRGESPAVSAEDGLATLAIVLAAYQSGAEKRPIHLS